MISSRIVGRYGVLLLTVFLVVAAAASLTSVLFVRSSSALETQLRETLRSTAAAMALGIDGDALDSIHSPADMTKPEFVETVTVLRGLVDQVPQIRFAYILRRTDDPFVLEFVADADALAPDEIVDRDGDGIVETDEEPSFPGEQYDISEYPALQSEAFLQPTTDPTSTLDQWGELFSGYAPIRSRTTDEVVAVLGIDMDATEFRGLANSALSPVAVIFIVLLSVLLAFGVGLLAEGRQLAILSKMQSERSGLLQLTFHQLGEPITILQWALETLEDTQGDVKELQRVFPENLRDMREGVRRLSSIIDALQEAEKVELQVYEFHPIEQSVERTIHDAIDLVNPQVQQGNYRIELQPNDGVHFHDPHLLTVVLRRILENALEYSHPGSTVRIGVTEDSQHLSITITDTGCGIPAADIPHLFEKYRRASNATNMKPDGNGLGLYTCNGIVELMGGNIHLTSKEGEGTTVTIRLPKHPKGRGTGNW